MKKKQNPTDVARQPMQEGLVAAFSSLDRQIARDVNQRSFPEQDEVGSGRSPAHQERIDIVTAFLIDCFSEEEIRLDSLLVMAQATAKALKMITADLGEDVLGEMYLSYCLRAFEQIERDAANGQLLLRQDVPLN